MSDMGIDTRASNSCTVLSICQRWRCIRVARIARIKTSKLCEGIFSKNPRKKMKGILFEEGVVWGLGV